MKQGTVFQTVIQIVFLLAVFVLVVIVSLGVELDFGLLRTAKFWVEITAKLVATLIFFNVVFEMDQRNRRSRTEGKYYAVMATNALKVRRIYQENLFEALDRAVAEENEAQRIQACDEELHKATTRLSYNDIDWENLTKGSAAEYAKKFLLGKRQARKLGRKLRKIANGRVRYEKVNPDALLKDKELDKAAKVELDVNYKALAVKRNASKASTFLLTNLLATAIAGFSLMSPNFWIALVINGTIFLGAVVSAFFSSASYGKLRQGVFEARNRFFERRLGIKDEYVRKPGE